ncbi:hypothetical protein diail_4739, partial [Diaporthe ilicicola]
MNTQPSEARPATFPSMRREGSLTAAALRHVQQRVSSTGRWLNPEESIGRYLGRVKLHYFWEATGAARQAFNRISPDIKAYLEDAVEPISSRVTWSMYMIGRVRGLAYPSIIFCSEVLEHRRDVRNTIRHSGILSDYPGIKTGHMSRPPDFNQLVPLADGEGTRDDHDDMMISVSRFKNACGSQLFVNRDGNDPGRLSTIGGVIRLGKNYYYTTAAHAFSPTSDSAATEQTLPTENGYETNDDCLSLDGNDSMYSATAHSRGDQTAIHLNPGYLHTSGSIFEHSQDLSLKPTGRLFMNSMKQADKSAGLDYVLIEMLSREHILENVIITGHDHQPNIKVHSVVRSELLDVEVFAVTHRGAIKGYMSGTPFYSSAPGQRFFTRMFKVSLDGPLYSGDCGAWVVNATNGDLIGHIVLGSPEDGTVLLVLFADIFDDVLSRVGESPTFPTARDDLGDEKTTEILIGNGERAVGISDVPFVKGHSEGTAITKHMSSETRGMKVLTASERDEQETTAPNKTQSGVSSHLEEAENDWVGDITKEFGRLMTQKRLRSSWHRNSLRESSEIDAQSNFGLPTTPTMEPSSARLTQGFQPRSFIPSHINRLNSLGPAPAEPRFRDMLFTLSDVPMKWENPTLLGRAFNEIDLETIYSAANEEHEFLVSRARSMGDSTRSALGYQDCVTRALMRYFNSSFFTSIDNPPCEACRSKTPTIPVGYIAPTTEERAGGVQAVELYECSVPHCRACMRFPRYWNVWTILRTRRGRTGESANCFGMLCRALGSRVRWVWSAEDRVWTEVYNDGFDIIYEADAVSDVSDGSIEVHESSPPSYDVGSGRLAGPHEVPQIPLAPANDPASISMTQQLPEQSVEDFYRGSGTATKEGQSGSFVNDGLKYTKSMYNKFLGKDALIAVMGMTGSGKTTFISKATGRSDLKIGHDLTSCTRDIQVIETKLGGQTVRFVDTPGFSDTDLSDTEVLQMIADYLAMAYKQEMKLSGIIYLHPISDNRVTHHTTKNLDMFRKLTGEKNLKNVTLTTTMWDKVSEQEGTRREDELKGKFWKLLVAMGARTARHNSGGGGSSETAEESARRIASSLLGNKPFYLQLQEEMGKDNKPLRDTAAGREVMAELARIKEEHRRELAEMEGAIRSSAEESRSVVAALREHYQGRLGELERTLRDERRMNEEAVRSLTDRIQALERRGMSCAV